MTSELNTIEEITEKLKTMMDRFIMKANAENNLAGSYGSMKQARSEHKAKSEAFDQCAAEIRILLNELNDE